MHANSPRSIHTCAQIPSRISVWNLHARTLDSVLLSLSLLSLLSLQQQCWLTSRWSHFCGEYGWSHARMMADSGCMHSYCLLQMWLRKCLVTVFLILKRKEAWHGPLDISKGWSELFRWCNACLCNAIFVSEKFGSLGSGEVPLTRIACMNGHGLAMCRHWCCFYVG